MTLFPIDLKKVSTRPAQKLFFNIRHLRPASHIRIRIFDSATFCYFFSKISRDRSCFLFCQTFFFPWSDPVSPFSSSTDDRNAVKVNISFPFSFRRRRRRISPKFGTEKKIFFGERFSLERKKKRERRIGGQKTRANWNSENGFF